MTLDAALLDAHERGDNIGYDTVLAHGSENLLIGVFSRH